MLDPYFSATKIEWLLEHVDGLRERAHDGTAVFGTVDSWLIFKLTGEHVTDASNASRTLLYDITAGRWDPELLELFDVPARALPRVRPSAGVFGETRPAALHGHAVPIAGVAGDQQAALFGQACVDPGMGKNTYRDRLVRAAQHGLHRARAGAGTARDGRLGDRRRGRTRLRAGGVDLRHRRRRAVAARRAAGHRARRGHRGAGRVA